MLAVKRMKSKTPFTHCWFLSALISSVQRTIFSCSVGPVTSFPKVSGFNPFSFLINQLQGVQLKNYVLPWSWHVFTVTVWTEALPKVCSSIPFYRRFLLSLLIKEPSFRASLHLSRLYARKWTEGIQIRGCALSILQLRCLQAVAMQI